MWGGHPSPAALGMNQERPRDDFTPLMFCSDSDRPTIFDADSGYFRTGKREYRRSFL
jgi:hypothetical protein